MNIRNATESDIPAMAEAYIAAFQSVDPTERWTGPAAEALLSFFLRTQPDLAFLAEENSKVLGGICGQAKPWWDGHHLVQTEIFISPAAQRNGIGRALFRHFVEVAKTRYKVTQMESITFDNLEFPSSWYLKLGFQNKSDWKVMIGELEIVGERLSAVK